jgi:MFS family permease
MIIRQLVILLSTINANCQLLNGGNLMNAKLIRQKDFALLICGKLVSLLGSNMLQFALSLYVLDLTGSATVFASILSILIIPRLIFSPFAGVFGDWFDRKKSVVMLDMLNAFVIGSFALIFTVKGNLSIAMIYALVILLETTEIFFHSAMAAVLPSIVSKEELLDANSLNSMVMNIGNLLAPAIGALIYGIFGMKAILIFTSICFLLSSISKMFINIPKNHNKPEEIDLKSFKYDLIEGTKLIKDNKFIRIIIASGGILNFCVSPLASIGLLYIIKEIMKASDFQFGLFQMILSSSFIIAPLIGGKHIGKIKVGRLLYLSFISVAAIVLAMALIPFNFKPSIVPYILILLTSFLIGMSTTFANIALGTFFDQIVPLELMGRISTIMNLSMTILIPIGQMIFGYLYDIIIPNYVIALAGAIVLITTLKYRKPLIEYGDVTYTKPMGDVQDEI